MLKKALSQKKSYINYKRLYLDFINGTSFIEPQTKRKLVSIINHYSGNFNGVKNLKKLNMLIEKHYVISLNQKHRQSLNTYDMDFINYVLSYQKEYNLSNNQISLEFKLSRNTIGKWRRLFN